MKPVFQHELLSSFYLWFDSYLLRKGEAYETFTTNFYHYSDERITDKVVFGSPYKQFVYDDSANGAVVIESLSGDGTEITKGTSGMMVDYENGRVLFDSDFATGTNISGRYSVKNFNTYISNQNEEQLILEGKYETNSRYTRSLTYVAPYAQVTPAAFLTIENVNNQPFALGGEDNTITTAKAVVFAENVYELDGILSVFADSNKSCFANIPFTGAPLNEYGDIKSDHYPNGYSYTGLANDYKDDIFMIDNTTVSKFSDRARRVLEPSLYVGFIDFEIHKYRFPRSS